MASDADAYERGVKISQTSLTPNFREGVQANPWFQLGYQMGMKHGASAAGMMSRAKSEFPAVASRLLASRPGAPDTFAEDIGLVHALAIARKTIRYNAAILGVMGGMTKKQAYELLLKHGTPKEKSEAADYLRRFSRPGAKARFKVEDRFYFGKGRKERFADDAKQIADTILKQLGGGRFIAMTGAKNLAFSSSPPGLRMSIGRGAKDAIKYLRVDYDRGSDTYTMIFANKSGGTVKSVSHVYADSLQRVFTSTTGFDTHL